MPVRTRVRLLAAIGLPLVAWYFSWLFAPERVGRLVLSAFTWTGRGSPTLAKRGEALAFFRANNRRPRDRDMIRSIFSRDHAG